MPNDSINPLYPPEKIAAIRKIRKLMDFWHITPGEIRVAPKVVKPAEVQAPPRYAHPVTAETWDGQGKQPDWLRLALTKEGYTVDELRQAVAAVMAGAVTAEKQADNPTNETC